MNESERVAQKTGRSILKHLDVRSASFAIAAAIGLNINTIAEKLARFVIGFSADQQEALDKMVEATGKAADAMEARLAKAQAAIEKATMDRLDREEAQRKLIRDFIQDGIDEEAKAAEEAAKASAKNDTALDVAFAKEQDRIAANKKEKMKANLEVRAAELQALKDIADAEEARIKEKFKSLIDQWTGFQVLIGSKGRGDTQLSDRELERKIANIQSEIGTASASQLGRYQGAAGTGQSDFLVQQQRGAASAAQGELQFRQQVRTAAATQGESAAFNQFNGLSEQRFREILQSAPGTADVVAELKKLNGQLAKGVPTVLFGDGG